MTATAVSTAARPRQEPAKPAVRTDIQALRALAVSCVVLYHLWPNRLTGGYAGVDVFFVISGFLITTHLVAHPPTRIRNLFDFWSRRIRRLLPAALLVLVAVLIASRLVAPATQWQNTATQARAAGLYVVNWRLAADAVNYLAADNAATPVQHFWSLSVEEQFYLGWPVLILLLMLVARWLRRPPLPLVFTGLAVAVGASLWYSVTETASDPARAFFVTPTRVWELGLGGLLAVLQAQRRLGRHRPASDAGHVVRLLLVWGGFAAIVASVLVFDAGTPWPGWRALAPTVGCLAVIAAGNPTGRGSPAALLALRPVQWLGNVSYSVYLWHWPLIVIEPNVSGDRLGRLDKLTIIVVSLVLAAVTKRLVEDPCRRPRWGRPLLKPFVFAAAGMAVVVAASGAQVAEVHHDTSQALASAKHKLATHDPCFGAPALPAGPVTCPPVTSGTLTPDPAAAKLDQTRGFENQPGVKDCLAEGPDYKPQICSYGPANASVRIAVVGNSHAFQFMSALAPIAEANGWRISTYVASTCTLDDVKQRPHPVAGDAAGCAKWVTWAGTQVAAGKFDLVITASRLQVGYDTLSYSPTPAQYAAGYVSALGKLRAAGEKILAIRDTPAPRENVPDCLARHSSDYTYCDGDRSVWLRADPLITAVQQMHDPGVTSLDLTRYLCTGTKCPAVIGGVPAYFDNSHMTNTFCLTLVPYIEPTMTKILHS